MSQTTLTQEDLARSAERLAESSEGRQALVCVRDLIDGPALDRTNQTAIFLLLSGAWGPLAGSAGDAIRTALGD